MRQQKTDRSFHKGRQDIHIQQQTVRLYPPRFEFSNRVLLLIVLLLLVFTLGLSNAFSVLNLEKAEFDTDRTEEATLTTISGKVIDKETGNDIEGALVTIIDSNQSALTNSEGWFTIENVKTGFCRLKAEKSGYQITILNINIISTRFQVLTFQLVPGEGQVTEGKQKDQEDENGDVLNRSPAILFVTFASFAVLSIILVVLRKQFWLAVIAVIVSMLSIGYFIGTVSGAIALVILFTIKNDFTVERVRQKIEPVKMTTLRHQKPLKRPARQHRISTTKSRLRTPPPLHSSPPLPPPPPPPPRRYSRYDGKPLPRPPRR